MLGRILDAVARNLRRAQVALNLALEHQHGALGIDGLDRARNNAVLVMRGNVVGERITIHLLDTKRNALALDIDGQDQGLDFVALLEVAHSLFARNAP